MAALPDGMAVFGILVNEHADMLMAFLRTHLGADAAVDDLFQETMLVAWRRLGDFDRSRPFAPWLRGIAAKLMMEYARKGRVVPRTTEPAVMEAIEGCFGVLEQRPGDSFAERAGRIRGCVERLPAPMREAIELVYFRKVSIVAVADVVGTSKAAAEKRVQRARQLLADCLGFGVNAT